MKKLVFLLLILSSIWSTNTEAAFIKQESAFLKFCEKYAAGSAIIASYPRITPSIQALPFIPFVGIGIVAGVVSKPNVIQDMCDVMTNLSRLNNVDGLFYSAEYLNTLTGKEWDGHLEMMKSTYSLADTLIDLESGKTRKGALKSASTHSEINAFMKQSYGWYNKTFNNRDAELKTRGERETEMNAYAQMVYKSTTLKEITRCPTPDSVDYERIYKKEVFPQEKIQQQSQDDIDYFKGQLLAMAPKFMNNEKQLKEYSDQLSNLIANSANLASKTKVKTETTEKRDPKKIDKNTKAPKVVKTTIKKDTYEYWVVPNDQIVNEFKEKWAEQWSSYVTAQFLSRGSAGLLMNPREKVENEFKDLYYECQVSRLMNGYSDDNTYEVEAEKRQKACLEQVKVDQKTANNLFSYYVTQLAKALRLNKQSMATLWTLQSWHLGQNRIINKKVTDNIQSEEVICEAAKNMSPGEMNNLNTKQMDVNNELKIFINKQYMMKTEMQKAELEARSKNAKENVQKMQFNAKRNKNDKKMNNKVIEGVPIGTSMGRRP